MVIDPVMNNTEALTNQSEDVPSQPIRWKPKSILIEIAPFFPRLQPVFARLHVFTPVFLVFAELPCLFALIMLLIKKVVVLF